MAKYIELEKAFTSIRSDEPEDEKAAVTIATAKKKLIRNFLYRVPATDVAPMVHGRWEIVLGSDNKEYMVCSHCRKQQNLTGVFSYCPNCGAKMDG